MPKNILTKELEQQNQSIDNTLCEHFPITRKELKKLIKGTHLRTWEAILAEHGYGEGCDHCHKVVTLVLQRLRNPSPKTASIKDPIEAFIARSNKWGRYMITPRLPGGEITAEQLRVLGEVSTEFKLTPKINLGQHIDLFGAKLEDLPQIWKTLIAVGFESGHTNGRSLGMVQTCLGEKWCGHALKDSTGLAIRLEHRYKGLLAPAKLKGAVSGCTTECAGALHKDFGVVATEKGWNLFIGGKGGIKPHPGVLLVRNVQEEVLIHSLDRFLLLYMHDAKKGMKPYAWLKQFDGGIRALQDLIQQKHSNVPATVEAKMKQYIDSTSCDWQKILEDPQHLSYFQPQIIDSKVTSAFE